MTISSERAELDEPKISLVDTSDLKFAHYLEVGYRVDTGVLGASLAHRSWHIQGATAQACAQTALHLVSAMEERVVDHPFGVYVAPQYVYLQVPERTMLYFLTHHDRPIYDPDEAVRLRAEAELVRQEVTVAANGILSATGSTLRLPLDMPA